MALNNPTVIFVPGAFHTSAHFQPCVDVLARKSWPATTVSLPGIGEKAARVEPYDDVKAAQKELRKLVEIEHREVVLVTHSYGGIPGFQAVKGLERSARAAIDQPGGIICVIFLAAFTIPEGKTIIEVLGEGLPPWAEPRADVSPLDAGFELS